ncbi:CPBP family glutamic-type intramembrane protease [Saccharopolyspora sp. WRP15-2]|uniref:CPBP family glutamic-type intramembrane protease n=1 Tax=Saccharopolyspora oryzae TaxID=2997343 RepID=A0ABT4VBG5_9PSEU|nr:CPBP family glutamic-type intramembrane protease [Saccharopolyspora oryzae]MDA3631303.1 CPBP family glutamic-type intramembrane protease [Saccharopolyspora oryzae]
MKRSPLLFFGLVFALGVPFWLLGEFSDVRLPANLPLSALQVVVPGVGAVLLIGLSGGRVLRFLRGIFDASKIPLRWYLPTLLLMPAITLVSYGMMGQQLPQIPLTSVLIYFALYVVAACAEEAGWTAYATDPVQQRWGALGGGVTIGVVWAAWHVVPYLQLHGLVWVLGQSVFTVAARVIIVWLHNNTGRSTFVAVLFHATINVCYSISADSGTYDPVVVGAVTLAAAVLIALAWTPGTLAHPRLTSWARR